MLNTAVENGITLELRAGRGALAEERSARIGDPKARESQSLLSQWHGNPRAGWEATGTAGLSKWRGANAIWASPGASSWLTRTASGARFPGRNGQMFQLPLSHFTVDGCGLPDSVNSFLTIPLVTGGRAPELRQGWGWGFLTSIARCAPHDPAGLCTHTNPKRWCLPGKLLPVGICKSKESPFFPKACTCPSQMGHFPGGSERGPGGCIAIQTASCRNCQIRLMRVGVRSLVKAC